MKITLPESAVKTLKDILQDNQDRPQTIRVYFAGIGLSLIHISQLILSFIIKGIISFGATPTLVAESIENPIAIIKHPNAIKNIFNK